MSLACDRKPEPLKPHVPASASASDSASSLASASAPASASADWVATRELLFVLPAPPDSTRKPPSDSVVFTLPNGTPVLQAHLDTARFLLESVEEYPHFPKKEFDSNQGKPIFYLAESFSDSQGTGEMSRSLLGCRQAMAKDLILSALLSGKARSISRGGLREDSLLTRWGCPTFRSGRVQYGLFPAGEGRAAWRPVDVRYDIDLTYLGRVLIPPKERIEFRIRVRPFTGRSPDDPQPYLFASTERAMPSDTLVWLSVALPFFEPELPLNSESLPALDSASLPSEKDLEISLPANPWYADLRVRWLYHWWEDPKRPDKEEYFKASGAAGEASLIARLRDGSENKLAHVGGFEPHIGENSRIDSVVITDLDGNGAPDHLFFHDDRGVEVLPGREIGGPEEGSKYPTWLVDPIDPGGC
jgi:hypothetical protein